MIDIKFLRENPDAVKENIKKKFQDHKLPLVDQVIELDEQSRAVKKQADELRSNRNKISQQIGALMAQGKKEEGMALKEEVTKQAEQLAELEKQEADLSAKVTEIMMQIPNIIDPSVPIGKDDSQNVEIEKFGDPFVPDFEIPYHTEIMEKFNGIDLDSARKVAGNGFYYLMGDIARLHSAVIAYARDFMINRGFTYCVPPFMIRSNVVTGVMSFAEMDSMMYKIEGEDLYLIGTSEHSMIGKFIGDLLDEDIKEKVFVCLDTCHMNDAGIDISKFDEFLDVFDKSIGINKIKCIHVKDSMNPIGSHKDRHANLGYGTIGFDNLINVIYNKRLDNIPKILETPWINRNEKDAYAPYKYEIEMIRNKKFNDKLKD